jgi:hypothetical protein
LVTAVEGDVVAAGDERVMTVYDASPLGTLAAGSEIVITYYVAEELATEEPTPTEEPSPSATQ